MNDDGSGCAALIVVAVVFGVIGGLFVWYVNNTNWKHEAVKTGHAEFYIDHEYNRQWRWLPTTQPAEKETNK